MYVEGLRVVANLHMLKDLSLSYISHLRGLHISEYRLDPNHFIWEVIVKTLEILSLSSVLRPIIICECLRIEVKGLSRVPRYLVIRYLSKLFCQFLDLATGQLLSFPPICWFCSQRPPFWASLSRVVRRGATTSSRVILVVIFVTFLSSPTCPQQLFLFFLLILSLLVLVIVA